MNNNGLIWVDELVKYYDGRCVLDEVSFKLPQGCIYGLGAETGRVRPRLSAFF